MNERQNLMTKLWGALVLGLGAFVLIVTIFGPSFSWVSHWLPQFIGAAVCAALLVSVVVRVALFLTRPRPIRLVSGWISTLLFFLFTVVGSSWAGVAVSSLDLQLEGVTINVQAGDAAAATAVAVCAAVPVIALLSWIYYKLETQLASTEPK